MVQPGELDIETGASALEMAETLFGNGITVLTASYSGAEGASGIYSGANTVAPGLAPADSGVILSTGAAQDITNASGDVNSSASTTTNYGLAGDTDLNEIAGSATFDAAVFEATFTAEGSDLTLQITFSSEEYLEYVGTGFNDAMAVFVNGEKATLTVGDGDVTINNINDTSHANLYTDNPQNAEVLNTEMDGVTATLTLKAPLQPGVNSIKIAIADGGDGAYDSNLLIAAGSVQTALIAQDDQVDLGPDGAATVDLLSNDSSTTSPTLTLTAINGLPVDPGDTLILSTGEELTLNADGSLTIAGAATQDDSVFSYTVTDGTGNTDTAFVTVTADAPCFVAGTMIRTPDGAIPVEALRPGDLVETFDDGCQPVRWVGLSHRVAEGADAPIAIAARALGRHRAVRLSPAHRVLIRSVQATLHFGTAEVLVKASDLVGRPGITQEQDGQAVIYVHVLFDRHQLIWGNGLLSESYHPTARTARGFEPDTQAELFRLFPELANRQAPTAPLGPTVRPSLKGYEGRLLGAILPPLSISERRDAGGFNRATAR